ncbi:hypothetical protein N2W54_006763 [Lotmaria passim]
MVLGIVLDSKTHRKVGLVNFASGAMLHSTFVFRRVNSTIAMVPACWSSKPAGWYLIPSSTVPETEELRVGKRFDFLNHSAQYLFLGQVMALAEEVKCIPRLQWFYTELSFQLPPTKEAEMLANYMNDQERLRCGLRNHSEGGTSSSDIAWSDELKTRVETRAAEDFCWLLTNNQRKTEKFLQETFIQWHHRADYLVTRKSREKREFRQDLTLSKVIQQGQERKRRMQQRRTRETQRQQAIESGRESEWDNFTHDVLPRELREALDRESDGMEDVRLSRAGTATGGWSRSMRSHPNFR